MDLSNSLSAFFIKDLPAGAKRGIIIGGGDIMPGITGVGDPIVPIGVNPKAAVPFTGGAGDWSVAPRPPPLIFSAKEAVERRDRESFIKMGLKRLVM